MDWTPLKMHFFFILASFVLLHTPSLLGTFLPSFKSLEGPLPLQQQEQQRPGSPKQPKEDPRRQRPGKQKKGSPTTDVKLTQQALQEFNNYQAKKYISHTRQARAHQRQAHDLKLKGDRISVKDEEERGYQHARKYYYQGLKAKRAAEMAKKKGKHALARVRRTSPVAKGSKTVKRPVPPLPPLEKGRYYDHRASERWSDVSKPYSGGTGTRTMSSALSMGLSRLSSSSSGTSHDERKEEARREEQAAFRGVGGGI